jgi:hypothetical protein
MNTVEFEFFNVLHLKITGKVFEPSTVVTAEHGHIHFMVSSSRLISCEDCSLHVGVQKAQTVSSVLTVGNQSVCRVASYSIMHHTVSPDRFSSHIARL